MLHFITELAIALRRGNLYLSNHSNFAQYNTILNYERAFNFFYNNAILGAVMYVTKLLENHSRNNVSNNQNYVLYYIFATLFNISLYLNYGPRQ